MASRLSEQSLLEVYDRGQKSFYIEGLSSDPGALEQAKTGLLGQGVLLDQLLSLENPGEAIQAVPAQELYHAIMVNGPEDSLEVLKHISQDQLIRFFDYDVWSKDTLEPLKVVRWLELYSELGPEELVKRFRELDEEYQTAFIGPLIKLADEDEYENLSDEEQDRFQALPCGQLHYSIQTENPRVVAALENLIQGAFGEDLNYLYALLTHGAYLPPHEQEHILGQMRQARLEEDGFLTFDESNRYFIPLSSQEQIRHLPRTIGGVFQAGFPSNKAESGGGDRIESLEAQPILQHSTFLERMLRMLEGGPLEQARHQLLTLANALCSASQVEPDDLMGAEIVLAHGRAMTSLGLEWVSGGDPHLASQFFLAKGSQLAFRTGITLCHQYAVYTLKTLEFLGFPSAKAVYKDYSACKYGLALTKIETEWLSILGFERVEWLKGLINRFPLHLSHHKVYGSDQTTVSSIKQPEHSPVLVFHPIGSLETLKALAIDVYGFTGILYSLTVLENGVKDHTAKMAADTLHHPYQESIELLIDTMVKALPPHQTLMDMIQSMREQLLKSWEGNLEGAWWQPPLWEKPMAEVSLQIIDRVVQGILGYQTTWTESGVKREHLH